MQHAWSKVREYVAANALHIKRGWRLNEISNQYILDHTISEIEELRAAPTDIEEMADIFACLIHYAQRMRWTERDIEIAIEGKLKQRFTLNGVDNAEDSERT